MVKNSAPTNMQVRPTKVGQNQPVSALHISSLPSDEIRFENVVKDNCTQCRSAKNGNIVNCAMPKYTAQHDKPTLFCKPLSDSSYS